MKYTFRREFVNGTDIRQELDFAEVEEINVGDEMTIRIKREADGTKACYISMDNDLPNVHCALIGDRACSVKAEHVGMIRIQIVNNYINKGEQTNEN